MLVFVDEFGDPGMEAKEGASKYFVVTAVLFEHHGAATPCDRCIQAITESRTEKATMRMRHTPVCLPNWTGDQCHSPRWTQ